jgi:hypothetical protein
METGMTGLGSGGDAKASGADRADTDPLDDEATMEADDDDTSGDTALGAT